MKVFFFLVVSVAAVSCKEKYTPPKVQVYSHKPGLYGKENMLICHVTGFHPPDIAIQLTKAGVELPDAVQTDLAFRQNWQFHLTKSVVFIPVRGEEYSCKVTHGLTTKGYAWATNA